MLQAWFGGQKRPGASMKNTGESVLAVGEIRRRWTGDEYHLLCLGSSSFCISGSDRMIAKNLKERLKERSSGAASTV